MWADLRDGVVERVGGRQIQRVSYVGAVKANGRNAVRGRQHSGR
jgi:hypothetical protein